VTSYVGTMQGVVDSGLAVCAHPGLKMELELKWPSARFIFSDSDKEFYGGLVHVLIHLLEEFSAYLID